VVEKHYASFCGPRQQAVEESRFAVHLTLPTDLPKAQNGEIGRRQGPS
jgi:hypothetical protein